MITRYQSTFATHILFRIIHPLSAIITAWLILELQKDQEPLSSSDALDEAAFLEYEVVTESEVSSVG